MISGCRTGDDDLRDLSKKLKLVSGLCVTGRRRGNSVNFTLQNIRYSSIHSFKVVCVRIYLSPVLRVIVHAATHLEDG